MANQYLLVDFENVQPANLGALKKGEWKVILFVGKSQTRIDLELARQLHEFGDSARYIQMAGSGKNALDFHVAFYLGQLSAKEPGAQFRILSKDTGFDPLIAHMKSMGIQCERVTTISGAGIRMPATKAAPVAKKAVVAKAPAKKAAKKIVTPQRFDEVVERLQGMKKAKPTTAKSFRSWLANFKPTFNDADSDAMLQALNARGVLRLEGTKLVHLP